MYFTLHYAQFKFYLGIETKLTRYMVITVLGGLDKIYFCICGVSTSLIWVIKFIMILNRNKIVLI